MISKLELIKHQAKSEICGHPN